MIKKIIIILILLVLINTISFADELSMIQMMIDELERLTDYNYLIVYKYDGGYEAYTSVQVPVVKLYTTTWGVATQIKGWYKKYELTDTSIRNTYTQSSNYMPAVITDADGIIYTNFDLKFEDGSLCHAKSSIEPTFINNHIVGKDDFIKNHLSYDFNGAYEVKYWADDKEGAPNTIFYNYFYLITQSEQPIISMDRVNDTLTINTDRDFYIYMHGYDEQLVKADSVNGKTFTSSMNITDDYASKPILTCGIVDSYTSDINTSMGGIYFQNSNYNYTSSVETNSKSYFVYLDIELKKSDSLLHTSEQAIFDNLIINTVDYSVITNKSIESFNEDDNYITMKIKIDLSLKDGANNIRAIYNYSNGSVYEDFMSVVYNSNSSAPVTTGTNAPNVDDMSLMDILLAPFNFILEIFKSIQQMAYNTIVYLIPPFIPYEITLAILFMISVTIILRLFGR